MTKWYGLVLGKLTFLWGSDRDFQSLDASRRAVRLPYASRNLERAASSPPNAQATLLYRQAVHALLLIERQRATDTGMEQSAAFVASHAKHGADHCEERRARRRTVHLRRLPALPSRTADDDLQR